MTYRMLTIDVDDTLMNNDLEVTPETKRALTAAAGQGIIVTLATGRMYYSAKNVAEQLNINVPLITYQGSLVKNSRDGKVLYERWVPENIARHVFEYAETNGYHIQAYCDDMLFAKQENDKVKAYANISKVPYHIEPNFNRLLEKRLTKVLLFEEPDTLERIREELEPEIGGQVHMTKSKPYFLEFLHTKGTKGHAVKFLADHFGIDLSEVIAIGDSWNDHEMIEVAGLGVAMGNAVEALKDIADYVTLRNDEDGVRHVVEKFILNR